MSLESSINTLVQLAFEEDLGKRGDVTSEATIPANRRLTGVITAKAPGVIAGLAVVKAVYKRLDPTISVQFHIEDGAHVQPGNRIGEITGSGRSVLTGERIALNFLQRLSGIATLAAAFVAAAGDSLVILDTRKTTPGWRLLEKYAVRIGGAQNHRMGLYDEVMIKDNHIDAAGSITAAVKAVRAYAKAEGLPIIVEVKDMQELREVLRLDVDRVLLDNFTEDHMREAVKLVGGRVPLEASGNITLERIPAVAATGVDYASAGALTHSAPALDLSMRLSPAKD